MAGGGGKDVVEVDAVWQSGNDGGGGPESAQAPAEQRIGVRAIMAAKASDQDTMPMLEVICDRSLPVLAASMRNLTSESLEVSLDKVGSGRFGDLMNLVPSPAMFGVFRIAPLDGHGVMVLEPALIYALVDALMGGQKDAHAAQRAGARSFTPIENGLMSAFMTLVLKEFADAFEVVAPVTIQLERSESLPRFATIVGPSVSTAHCRFRVELDCRVGHFGLLLPSTTLDPVGEKLSQRFLGDSVRGNAAWAQHFEREIRRSTLRVCAILAERAMPLHQVLSLSVGQTIPLGRSAHAPVVLQLEGMTLGQAEMGQRNNRVSVRLLDNQLAAGTA